MNRRRAPRKPRESENGGANKRVDSDSAVGGSLKGPIPAGRCAGHPTGVGRSRNKKCPSGKREAVIKLTPLIISVFVLAAVHYSALPTEASWLVYYKPAFKGKVVDRDTKKPVEGAAVVVIYRKRTLGLGAGTIPSVINVKETVTDREGGFQIPSFMALMQPFSWTGEASFIIYKPGYACNGEIGIEDFLSGRATKDIERAFIWNKKLKFRYVTTGTIEMPAINDKDERLKSKREATFSGTADANQLSIPILNGLLNSE